MELDPKEQLKSDMTAMASSATKNARGNYAAAYTMTTLSVVASIAATVMASSNINSKWAVALVASLPAAAIGIKNVFMFERKADWHWRKTKRLESLYRALVYESRPPAEISNGLSRLEIEMEDQWVYFDQNAESSPKETRKDDSIPKLASPNLTDPPPPL